MTHIRQLLDTATARLAASPSPRLDAEVLLAHALGVARSYLHAWPEREPEPSRQQAFQALLARRASGEPVAYLTGEREFWSLRLHVSPDTLIPRADTELLVELALRRLPLNRPALALDLGTGSGAIALAIAHERPACQVLALDRSLAALRVAQANAQRLGLTNLACVAADWLTPLRACGADLIVSNPPYIAPDDPHLGQGDLRYEPRTALQAEQSGLADLNRISHSASVHLKPGAWLLLEHGATQAQAVCDLLQKNGYTGVATYPDLAGQPRVSGGRSPG